MKTYSREETTEANRAVGALQGYTTGSGVFLSPTGAWGYLEKDVSECGGTQYWFLFVVLMILI